MVKTASFKLTCTPDRRHRSSINQPNGMSSAARDHGVEAREPLELPSPAGAGGGQEGMFAPRVMCKLLALHS